MNKCSLMSVSELITKGTTPSTVGGNFTLEGVNFVKSESICDSKYLNSNIYLKINKEIDEKLKRSRLKEEDLLFSIAGAYLGKLSIVRQQDLPANTNQAVGIVRLNKEIVDVNYIYYFFSQPMINKYINKLSSQSSQPNLNLNLLGRLNFNLIKIKEQKSIAKVLSDLDSKIELNNKINAELEAMAKLIYDYWFVQFDFPDANGKPYKSSGGKMVYNKELKRDIPDGWSVFQLFSILKSNYSTIGKNDSFEKIKYLDTGSLTKNVIAGTEQINTNQDKVPSRAKRIIQRNDILYSTVRPNLCHYGIIKNPLKNMIGSTGFVQLSSKIDWISNDLIYTFLTSSWVTERLQQIAALSVSAYPSISPNDILDLNVVLPKDGKNIKFINSKFNKIYSKISLNQKENQKLSELRDWLLPMLMNGQITVKND